VKGLALPLTGEEERPAGPSPCKTGQRRANDRFLPAVEARPHHSSEKPDF